MALRSGLRSGAIPIIPPRKNARVLRGAIFEHRNAAIAACRRLGRGIWKLPAAKSDGNQDELHQAVRLACDVSYF